MQKSELWQKGVHIFNASPLQVTWKLKWDWVSADTTSLHVASTDGLGNVNFYLTLIAVQVRKCQIRFLGPLFNYTRTHSSESSEFLCEISTCLLFRKTLISVWQFSNSHHRAQVEMHKTGPICNWKLGLLLGDLYVRSWMQNSRTLFKGNMPYTPVSY